MHAPVLTLKDFCDSPTGSAVRRHINRFRARRLRAVKSAGRLSILRADAEVWAASLPELKTVGRERA